MAEKKKTRAESLASPGPLSLKIDWHVGEQIVSRYASQLVVQCGEQECYISFFEIAPPLVGIGLSAEETIQHIMETKSIRADCVSRVIVPINKVPEFVEAIKSAYEKRNSLVLKPPVATGGDERA